MDSETASLATIPRTEKKSGEILTIDSSIDLEGNPYPERLITDGQKLIVRNDLWETRRKLHVARIEEVRIEPSIGSCFLQARIGGRWIDVLRRPGKADQRLIELADKLASRISRDDSAQENDNLPAHHAVGSTAESPREEQEPPPFHAVRNTARFISLLRPFRGSVILLLALSFGAVTIDVIPPMLQRVLVDNVLQVNLPKSLQGQLVVYLSAIVGGLLIVRVAATLIAIWKGIVSARVGTTMTAGLRNQLVEKLNALPMAFHDRNQVGVLMSRVAYDTEALHTLVYHMTSGFLMQSLQLLGIGVMLFYLNPKLALITLLPMPLIILGSWYFTRHLQPRHRHYWEAVGKQASALMGMLSGIRVVKAFVQEDREIKRFCESSHRLRDSRQGVESSTAIFTALMGLFFALGTLAVWYIGGRDVMAGTMTLGSLMAFLAYLAVFYTPLTTIVESTAWFANFFSISRRISELLDAPNEFESPGEATLHAGPLGRVEFHDVSFGYDRTRPVLKEVSFAIAPGEMVGVVGRSGSGKSTLISLIARLYEADSGQILIDGADVRKLNPRLLRRKMGMVPQDPFLFHGSIAENIAYGNMGATPEQILSAAKQADAHDFILRSPFAYETQLGDGGLGLSGGERQRLSIARALLCDPDILILDEITASVDAESERAICHALRQGPKKRTIIVIAHRLSTLRNADRLLVFENGRLMEQGSPDELLAREGIYAGLVKIQSGRNGSRHKNPAGRRTKETKELVESVNGNAHDGSFGHFSSPSLSLYDADRPESAAPASRDFSHNGNGENHKKREGDIDWLEPVEVLLESESSGLLRVRLRDKSFRHVFAVPCFPSLHEGKYIGLRQRKPSGREIELGIITSLDDWPASAREAVQKSLNRRCMFRTIQEIQQMRYVGNQLVMSVGTDVGPKEFQLEKSGESSHPFRGNGLLLSDTDGNYYAIPDRQTLPKRQQQLLNLYLGD